MRRDQRIRYQALVLVLLITTSFVEAQISVISDVTTIQYINSDLQQSIEPQSVRTVTVRCPVSEWGQTSEPYQVREADGSSFAVTVRCNKLVDYYAGVVVGYVPPKGQLYEQEVCMNLLLSDVDHTGDYLLLSKLSSDEEILEAQNARLRAAHQLRLSSESEEPPERYVPLHTRVHRGKLVRTFEPVDLRSEVGTVMTTSGLLPTVPTFAAVTAGGVGLGLLAATIITPPKLTSTAVGAAASVLSSIAMAFAIVKVSKVGAAIAVVFEVISAILSIVSFATGNSFEKKVRNALVALSGAITDLDTKTTQLAWSLYNYQTASNNYFRSIQEWQGNVTEIIGDLYTGVNNAVTLIGKVQTNLEVSISIQQQALSAQAQVIETIQQTTDVLAERTTQLSGNVNTLASLIVQSAQAGTALTQQVYSAVQQVANSTREGFEEVRQAMNATEVDTDNRIRELIKSIGVVNAAVIDTAQDRNVLQSLTYLTQAHILNLKYNYTALQLTPFLTHFGAPPDRSAIKNSDGYTDSYFVLDSLSLFYVDGRGSGLSAHYDTVALECAASFLIQSTITASSWRDVMDNIGPSTCSNVNSNTTAVCKCRFRLRKRACLLAQPESITPAVARQRFVDARALGPAQCVNGNVPDTSVRVIYEGNQIVDYLRTMCLEGFYAGTPAFVGSTVQAAGSSTTYTPSTCSMDFGVIQNSMLDGVTVPYLFFQNMLYALGNGALRAPALSYLLYGLMPGGMSYSESPAENDDGNINRCVRSAFMAYDTTPSRLLPVISYTRTRSTASAVVTVDGVDGSARSLVTVGGRTAAVIDSFVSVGYPDDDSVVYNIPQGLLPLTPNPAARASTVTYPMLGVGMRNMFNATIWKAKNGMSFNAYDGSVTADQFAYYASPQTRQCTTPVSASASQLSADQDDTACRMRLHGQFNRAVQNNAELVDVGYTPNENTLFYDVAVTFPAGTISSLIYTTCPVMDVIRTSPVVNVVHFSNPTTKTINFAVELQGACPDRQEIALAPGTAYQYKVFTCAAAASGGGSTVASTLTVRRLYQNGLESNVVCQGSGVDVSVDRNAYISNFQTVDQTYISTSSTSVVNVALQSANENSRVLLEMATRIVGYVLDLSSINGLAFPPLNTSGIDAVVRGATDLIATNNAQAAAFASAYAGSEANMTSLLQTINQLKNTSQAKTDAASAEFWQLFNKTSTDLAETGAKTKTLEGLYNTTEEMNARFTVALANLTDAQVAYIKAVNNTMHAIQNTFWAMNSGRTAAGVSVFVMLLLMLLCFPICKLIWDKIFAKLKIGQNSTQQQYDPHGFAQNPNAAYAGPQYGAFVLPPQQYGAYTPAQFPALPAPGYALAQFPPIASQGGVGGAQERLPLIPHSSLAANASAPPPESEFHTEYDQNGNMVRVVRSNGDVVPSAPPNSEGRGRRRGFWEQ